MHGHSTSSPSGGEVRQRKQATDALSPRAPGNHISRDTSFFRPSPPSGSAGRCHGRSPRDDASLTTERRHPGPARSSLSSSMCGRVLIAEDALKALFHPSRKRAATSAAARASQDTPSSASKPLRPSLIPLSQTEAAESADSSGASGSEHSSQFRADSTAAPVISWVESFLRGDDTCSQKWSGTADDKGERAKKADAGWKRVTKECVQENDVGSLMHSLSRPSALRIPVVATALGLRVQPFWRSGNNRVRREWLKTRALLRRDFKSKHKNATRLLLRDLGRSAGRGELRSGLFPALPPNR
ncbi:hypothetical protein CSUI_008444 [Cystoisospora suis]|uniref:Uncharacterized protein n=1 Tax=Cystoisospora suis TaxID=483139 RepID=A0A2C6JNF3_9APIC|nr:hypothetical protein CSUI_008444 [Cystoisospora suis]